MAATTPQEDRFKITTRVLVVLASVLAFLSIFTTWIDQQVLDTDEWVATSGKLLEDEVISDTIAEFTVERLFASVDVSDEIKKNLPDQAKPLSAPAAGAIRQFSLRIAQDALKTGRLQAAWKEANRTAHANLVAVLKDDSSAVSTTGGVVMLDLRPVVEQLASRVGVDKELAQKIPPDVAEVEIVRSDQLKTAQEITRALQGLAIFFSIGALALFALAAYLARGRRWTVVLGYGTGLIVAGVAVLALRRVGSGLGVDQLVTDESARPAADHAFSIATELLSSIATGVIVLGIGFVIAAFLASPADAAVSTRRTLAPTFNHRPAVVWSVFAAAVLLYLITSPPHSADQLYSALALIALAAFGMEALGRKVRHEFPDAKPGDLRERVRERVRELGAEGAKRTRAAFGDIGDLMERERDPEDVRLDRLAKLGELRDNGILTAGEFKAEKARLLGTPNGAAAPRAKKSAARGTRKKPAAPVR